MQFILKGSRVAGIKGLRNKCFCHCCSFKQSDYLKISLLGHLPVFSAFSVFFPLGVKDVVAKKLNCIKRTPMKQIIASVRKPVVKLGIR